MKNIFLSLFFLSFGTATYAQFGGGSLEKANKYYENYSYELAIEKYIEAQDYSIESQRNLATSYYKTGNTKKAEELFAVIVEEDGKVPEDVFIYASILQENEKYEESDKWMEVFNSLTSTDSRGILCMNDKGYHVQLNKNYGLKVS